jgi:cellulose synthase/poly-beta-1,6-N-acetylglucosamine synthase-like glycosyltransferase
MAIYFTVVFGFYFVLLIILWLGWMRTINRKTSTLSKTKFISVVVAMRNEKLNLPGLLQSLSLQSYSSNFEVIVVDDHSNDGSSEEAKKWSERITSLSVLSLDESHLGKKAALALGISVAKGEIIATTDADCILPVDWLQRINEGFQNENTNMLIGAVALKNENDFFDNLQSIEFASVIGAGMALGALGKPTMCNGANLSFRKKIFSEVNGYAGNEHIASGDDEFLMRKIENHFPGSIEVLTTKDAFVITGPQGSVKEFIAQRLRWASKWKANSSVFARFLAVFMFVTQITWIVLMTRILVDNSTVAIAMFLLKLIIDFLFLSSVCFHLKMKFNLPAFACLQFLYPVYVLYIGIFSQVKNHQWKGRVS